MVFPTSQSSSSSSDANLSSDPPPLPPDPPPLALGSALIPPDLLAVLLAPPLSYSMAPPNNFVVVPPQDLALGSLSSALVPPQDLFALLQAPPLSLAQAAQSPPSVAPNPMALSPSPVAVSSLPLGASLENRGPSSSWASKFNSSINNLKKMAPPSYLEDGTPSVTAPDSIRLQCSDIWKNHLVGHFHGSPPSVAKIFSDLNPIWGGNGRISVKIYSSNVCLFYIPCEATRKWVLDVAFWQSGNCAFSLSPWSPSTIMASSKLERAPVWVLIHNIPPQMYSYEGLSVIGSGIGDPLYTDHPLIESSPRSVAKIKICVVLDRKQPASI